jgi:hypothetical protein
VRDVDSMYQGCILSVTKTGRDSGDEKKIINGGWHDAGDLSQVTGGPQWQPLRCLIIWMP